MTGESNSNNEIRLAQIVEQEYEKLFNFDLVIATTSKYRQEVFKKFGFKSVSGVLIEDIDEKAIKRNYEDIISPHANPEDKFRSKHTEEVAAGKVEKMMGALPNFGEGSNKFLVGLDTLPIYFGVDGDKFKGNAVDKNSPDKVKKTIIKELNQLVEAVISEKSKVLNDYEGSIGFREIGVEVSTGIAFKFPDEKHVRQYSANSFLEFENIKELARREQTGEIKRADRLEAIEKITDSILAVYNKKGMDSSSISGGINFADDDIRKILDIREYPLDKDGERTTTSEAPVERGLYLGAPQELIKQILKAAVKDRVLAGKF
ncbi:MAG: hypothetical protein WCX97_03860 [Candidatus Magasanikbacteria bacterium]